MIFAVILAALLIFPLGELRAQSTFYQGKTITFIVGSGAGTAYDMYGKAARQSYRQVHTGKSERHCAEYAGGRRHRRGELRLRGRQARRSHRRRRSIPAHYFNQTSRQQGNEIRLDEIHLARQFRQVRTYALYAHGRSVQNDSGHSQGDAKRPSAALPAPAPAAITFRACSKRRSALSLPSLPATPAAMRSIWPRSETKWCAVLLRRRPTSRASPTTPGARKICSDTLADRSPEGSALARDTFAR